MKKPLRFVVGSLVAAICTMGVATHSALAEKPSELSAVEAANGAFYAALSARDVGAMMKVWSPKAEVRHIGPRNKQVDVGLDALKKNLQATFETFPELKVTPAHVQIRIVGAVAWVSDLENTERKNKAGERLTGSNFGTSIFQNEGGKWLMVYHHSSIIPE